MACSKSSKNMVDFFSNAPDIVIDKILESLPIRIAARTSVLSKQWRRAWLSLKILSFDMDFWGEQKDTDWLKCNRIISNILLSHDGPVHEFSLYIRFDPSKDCLSDSQWISFLSKNGVRKFHIANLYPLSRMDITSNIFRCSEIEFLMLRRCNLNNAPSTDFSGFPNLRTLVLENVHFNKPNIFRSLIENCKMLEELGLVECGGLDHVVVDVPSLQSLAMGGDLESLAFRNYCSLKRISLFSNRNSRLPKNLFVGGLDAANLQSICFIGDLCKFLDACGLRKYSLVTFNHLNKLSLGVLCLSEYDIFRDLLFMIERCPNIKKLDISVNPGKNVGQDIVEFNYNYKLDHLREVSIDGITGSSAELKLVEYLLAISPVLENMFLKCCRLRIGKSDKISRALMGFPRASPKARLLFLD